ncbi:response regulator (plasmid) [Sphingomonas paeninsulae]|uniref:Response regulator n=1 Tax=Sphingomonas paeninsulae TaxID=2319844 RepID=A0A494TGT8_SPHPE|nr:response regulator [Sphingomonas paeninsulae]AYJ84658.1 response regulator [Sphingomonas paeninsulae]
MLERTKILIVEDEAVIAMHLSMIIEDCGGEVIGPAHSVAEALELIAAGAEIDGAVLDGNLGDADITPVALELVAKDISVVIYSGVGIPSDLASLHPDLPVVLKPQAASKAISLLVASIEDKQICSLRVP